jgi:predicted porin
MTRFYLFIRCFLFLIGIECLPCFAHIALYGRINTAIELNTIEAIHDTSLRSASSRFGIKGEETISSDFSVEFQVENGFDAAGTSAVKLAGRDTFIGVKNEWGAFKAGNNLTPSYRLFDSTVTKFHDTGNASYLQIPGSSLSLLGDLGARLSESILYQSSTFSNFSTALLVASAKPRLQTQKIIDGNVLYQDKYVTAGIGVRTYQSEINEKQNTVTVLAGKYTIPTLLDISLAYERGDYRATFIQSHRFFFSAQYTHNAWGWILSAGIAENIRQKNSVQPHTKAYQTTLGVTYDFSERTQLYAYCTQLHNQAQARYQFLETTGHGFINKSITIGIRRNF